jgi:hypothetical protein
MKRIKFKAKDGKDYGIFLDQITYYRSYVESSDKMGDTPSLRTSVYLVGSTKAMVVPISFQEFDKRVEELS